MTHSQFHEQGCAYAQAQAFDKAIDCFKQALEHAPDHVVYHMHLANAYQRKRCFQLAHAHYDKALALQPEHAETHHNLAVLYCLQENDQAALTCFQKALDCDPKHPLAAKHLSNLYLKQGHRAFQLAQFDQAEHAYQAALAAYPENLDALNNLGAIALKKENPEQAIAYFTNILIHNDTHEVARCNLAATFLHLDHHAQAITHCEWLHQRHPDNPEILYNLGFAYMAMGEQRQALQAYQKVLTLVENHLPSLINLGAIYLKTQDLDRASACFKQVLHLEPDHPTVQYMLAALQGDRETNKPPPAYIQGIFDHYAFYYDTHLERSLKYTLPSQVHSMLAPYLCSAKPSALALDLGCGTGLSVEPIANQDLRWIGVDLSFKMLKHAQKKRIYTLLIQTEMLDFLNTSPCQFSLIIALDSFNYLGNLHDILKRAYAHLSPSGLLAFTLEVDLDSSARKKHPYFSLQTHGRFKHRVDAVLDQALQLGYQILENYPLVGRYERDQPIQMRLLIFSKKDATIESL